QPPKRKGTSKKSAKANVQTLINGRTKEETTKEQIEEYIAHLQEQLDREMDERNYFQLERDQVHTLGQITAKKLEEVLAEEKNLEKGLEEDEEHHQVEIKVYKQKMKHLLCEHQSTISELKEEALVSKEKLQKELDQLELEFHKKIKAGMVEIQELNNDLFERKRLLVFNAHKHFNTKINSIFDIICAETAAKYEEHLKLFQEEMENTEASLVMNYELERDTHMVAFQEEMSEVFNSTQEVTMLREQNRDIISEIQFHFLHFSSQQSIKTPETKTVDDLKLENETLEQKLKKLQLEKEQLYNSVMPTIEGTREKVGLRSTLLRRKLQDLTDSLEKSQAQLFTVLSVPNMDHTVLSEIANKSEVMFSCALSFKTQFCYLFYKRRTEKNVLFVGRFRQKKICHQEHCIQKE
uniref:Dynein regulatory complex subunit 4 n=1 Tax=Oryzias melastigma TaxID=30732 RepID=A0A3B3B7Y9_ORYME